MASFITSSAELDTRVTFEALTRSLDPVYEAAVEAWAPAFPCWAKVEESASAGESAGREGEVSYARPHRVWIRWRADVSTAMRIRLRDGRLLQINGSAALGRRQWLEFSCTEWEHQQS